MYRLTPRITHRVASGRRMAGPPLVFGAMLAASLLFRCSDKSGGGATVAGGCPSGVCGGAGAGGQPQGAGSGGVGILGSGGGTYPPALPCTDRTVNTDCPLPARNGGGAAGMGGTPNGVGGTLNLGGAGGTLSSGGAGGMTEPSYLCADAGVARDCPVPPPVCADASTLATYDQPSCSYGTCSWLRHSVPCRDTGQAGHCPAGYADETACFTGGACVLPPSECLDGETMLYFSNPRCADVGSGMRCVTEGHAVDCGNRGFVNGGCLPRSTLAL